MSSRKIRVAVLYGGRSSEHEVSLRSAASVVRNLDTDRFEIVPIAIDKQGRWLLNDIRRIDRDADALPVYADAPPVSLPPNPASGETALVPANASRAMSRPAAVDVVFPVMHGPLCEDGTIQGLLDLADVAYVGCGVLGSAVGMDKDVAKRLARDAGIPVVPWITLRQGSYARDPQAAHKGIARELGFPVFVKPANLGSSVGVHKVKTARRLPAALRDAFTYDPKVLVERAVERPREIEVSVLESLLPGDPPLASIPGEVIPKHEFYSYKAKYLDENGAALMIPAPLTAKQSQTVRRLASEAFSALEGEGMARADFLMERDTGKFYFNEVNTIPGFTQISMYPKLWEATGLPYRELLTRLVELAIARQERRRTLKREYVTHPGSSLPAHGPR